MFPTTITSWALLVSRAIDESGLNSSEIFNQAGLDPNKLRDPNARYSFAGMTRLWRLAAEKTGDPCIGLKAARLWHPTTMHALGYSWLASASLLEAVRRLVRYLHLLSTASDFVLEEGDEVVRLILRANNEISYAVEAVDAAMAVIVDMCRTSYGNDFCPLKVSMRRPTNACENEFKRVFRAPIQFGASENSISFSREQMVRQLSTANVELARINDRVVAEYLADLDKSDVAAQVKARIIYQLPSANISEETIAQELNKSVRSLQRKLTEQGVSYKSILEETRQELAMQYVKNRKYSMNEITYLLGFSETSNFSRAFKRWTGRTPTQYRELQ